jgi:hypothetical protein
MKTLQIIIYLILFNTTVGFSHDNLICEILQNKSVLRSLIAYRILKPPKVYLCNRTDKWNDYRFQVSSFGDSNFADEHHPYNHTYFFKDKKISKLFSLEANSLYQKSNSLKIRTVPINPIKGFQVIDSINKVKNGLLMTFSEPILSKNKEYCFVELKIYQVSKTDKDFYSSEGLILKKANHKWQLFHKVGGMIF